MSEPYTPTTEEVLGCLTELPWYGLTEEEFDRWLDAIKAEARLNAIHEMTSGFADELREVRADAWDEGRKSGMDDMERSEMDGTWGEFTANPYRKEAGR